MTLELVVLQIYAPAINLPLCLLKVKAKSKNMLGKQSESTKCKSLKRASVEFFVMKTRFSNCTLKTSELSEALGKSLHYSTIKDYETQSPCHVNTDHYHLENKQK